ncbi:hypothetical protein Rs2_29066 [Raphanus sativus]|nr:hypothetical protein Rs2_29066 [Raphanus sativus]
MAKEARSQRVNILSEKRNCVEVKSATLTHTSQSDSQALSSAHNGTLSSFELTGRERHHHSGETVEQNNGKFQSNCSAVDNPDVQIPGPESFTDLLRSMVTQNTILESNSFNYGSPQSSVVGGLHSQKESTDGSPMNIREFNFSRNSVISPIASDSDSEESCDDIWHVDTSNAENEYHYFSETESEDESQVVEEHQEDYNNGTSTSLGRIDYAPKLKRRRTQSKKTLSNVTKEGKFYINL